jgi:uroporphyrin-III C-methyltransferase/precorrin-2 dehydrogenase/sirohydrochlorin ferrochelatase
MTAPTASPRLYPLFLNLHDRLVVVVGAGAVAAGKIEKLLEAGAQVTVVAPDAVDAVRRAATEGRARWQARNFEPGDLDHAWLVVAATGRRDVDAAVALAAAERRIFVNAVDDPQSATAYAAGVIRRGDVTVAISSGGRAPALTRILRTLFSDLLPETAEVEEWLRIADRLRREWRGGGTPMSQRWRRLLQTLAHGERQPDAPSFERVA